MRQVTTVSSCGTRRGLVIAGGGAKGAYSFGCLKALHEAGVTFEAVAATSAGALNGAIWSSGDIAAGEALWRRMAPTNTYKPKNWPAFLPATLWRVFMSFGIGIGLVTSRLVHGPVAEHLEKQVVVAAAMLLWLSGTLLFAYSETGELLSEGYAWFALGCFGIYQGLRYQSAYARWILGYPITFGSLTTLIDDAPRAFIYKLVAGSAEAASYETSPNGLTELAAMLLSALVFVAITLVAIFVFFLVMSWFARLTMLSSLPLRQTIREFLTGRPLRLPFYATVAFLARIYDPDRQRWSLTFTRSELKVRQYQAEADELWVPRYFRVDELELDRQVDVLAATAALPFGFVSSVWVADSHYVDGALADNEPIAPLLCHDLDEIWMLRLDPEEAPYAAHIEKARELLRLQRLVGLPRPELFTTTADESPPYGCGGASVIPYPWDGRWPTLRYLAPVRPLGGLFDGLLNFTPEYASVCIQRGYEEANLWLQAHWSTTRRLAQNQ